MPIRSASERTRSPRFPGYSIGQVIEFAKRVYEGVHRATVPSEEIFKLMGFAGKSGPSAAALGALRQFGLIEGTGDRTRISDLALSIVQPASEDERIQGVRQAARNPEVFRLIYERFGERIPSADDPIKAYLIRELGFSKRGADECLNSLRRTLRTLEELTGDTSFGDAEISPDAKDSEREAETPNELGTTKVPEHKATQQGPDQGEFIRIPLTRECVAELRFSGHVTERAVANLMRHIDLMKDVWSEE